jgi:hypothetical protein
VSSVGARINAHRVGTEFWRTSWSLRSWDTKVDTTMNVYTQVLDGAARLAADRVGSELFRVVHIPDGTTAPTH